MTSLLSSISGVFSKSLILGIFLPVIVFIVFTLLLVIPLAPTDFAILKPLQALDTQWQVITITFIAILMSGLLYNLNIPLIRMYDGYPWMNTWVGRLKTRRNQSEFEAAVSRQRGMRTLLRAMGKAYAALIAASINRLSAISPDAKCLQARDRNFPAVWGNALPAPVDQWGHIYELVKAEWEALSRLLLTEYPGKKALVLQTKLGNVIRSFEYYPDREYGIDAVTLWPRLIAKIDKDYAALVDDTKTSFDFMLNGSALSATLALLILLAGLAYGTPLSSWSVGIPWLAEVLLFIGLSIILYFQSISRAFNWGDMVKGAFDLYRNDLLKLLGFKQELKTKSAERNLWDKISVQMIYGDTPNGPRTNYADDAPDPSLLARGDPADIQLEVSKGIDYRLADFLVGVALVVKNVDPGGRIARQVVLTDTLPQGLDYVWGSARLNGQPLQQVAGSNPYRFTLGDMRSGDEFLITYAAFQHKV